MAQHWTPWRRRSDARRWQRERWRPGRWTWASLRGWAVVFGLAFTVLAAMTAVGAQSRDRFASGQRIPFPVVSRAAFQTIDQAKTQEHRRDAHARQPAVYIANTEYLIELTERLRGLRSLGEKQSIEEIPPAEREALQLTAEGLSALQRFARGEATVRPTWNELVDRLLVSFADLPVLPSEQAKAETLATQRASSIILMHPTRGEQSVYEKLIIDVEQDRATLTQSVERLLGPFPRELRPTVLALLLNNPRPVYTLDAVATEKRKRAAQQAEQPVLVAYTHDSLLIPAGKELTPADLHLIRLERRAYLDSLTLTQRLLRHSGTVGLMMLFAAALWVYLAAYYPRVESKPMRGLALTALIVGCQALSVGLTRLWPQYTFGTAIFPPLLAVMILTIAYDQRLALMIGFLLSLMVTVSLQLPVGFLLVSLTGLAAAVVQLRQVRTRSKLVVTGLWSGLAMAGACYLVALRGQPLHLVPDLMNVYLSMGLTLLTGFATGMLAQTVLPAVERVFKVATAMTLKELNDASHPLLHRLAQEAPGTYQHSLRIADMAEAAAEAIGAHGLLCRVGAMYHDVGKVNKPMYFVENQGGGPNRHARLSPAMSLLIIVGHVKDGLEMAREFGLPGVLRQFIETHHGTTLVEYFYHAAKRQNAGQDTPAPAEFEYRYPGPKPQTREAAILMICDGVEGAARSLTDPNPSRLEQLVHDMAQRRLMDGQFDECALTFDELRKIEHSVTKTLCAMYHGRIAYPAAAARGSAAAPAPG